MKKFNTVGLIVSLIAGAALLILARLSPGTGQAAFVQTSSAAQIPQALVLAVNALLLAGLTFFFKWLLDKIGLDLTSYATPLSVTLSTFLLGLAQHWIDLQPVTSDPFIMMALNILVVVLGGLGSVIALHHRANLFASN